jgi:tetratricopeptide (TPR) repeat protein
MPFLFNIHPLRIYLLGNLAVVYLSLNDYPKALENLQQSLAIAREIKYREGMG